MQKNQTKLQCRLCNCKNMDFVYTLQIINKYNADYYKCPNCGYFQINNPFWLDECYSSTPIANIDDGILFRNIIMNRLISTILYFYDRKGCCLDIGGGYGILVRLLRDIGFESYWKDPYSKNLFAKNFEYDEEKKINSLIAIEVLEHLTNPIEFIKKYFNDDINLFFISTKLYKNKNPSMNWEYLALKSGQHIGFLNNKSLNYISKQLNMYCYSIDDLHVFSKSKISKIKFSLIAKFNRLLAFYVEKKMSSLLFPDNKNNISN
jgi:hypothetical protein